MEIVDDEAEPDRHLNLADMTGEPPRR
jgi:hypothetical protein